MTDAQFRKRYNSLRKTIDVRARALARTGPPDSLHDGCRYVLESGGKRIRSILLALSCEAVGGNLRASLDAGVAIETFHNFTLVHDDIMDNSHLRRGQPTVHARWNVNTALLVGDVLLSQAYESLLRTPSPDPIALALLMTEALRVVCEGQALDMEFEQRTEVTSADYFRMIEKKTGRLISVSTELGAVIGGGTPKQVRALRTFGHHLGKAFQLQDDLLDVIATEKVLGKPVGGDIAEGKKTYLLLTAADRTRGGDHTIINQVLRRHIPQGKAGRQKVVAAVSEIYRNYGIIEDTAHRIHRETQRAVRALDLLPESNARAMLRWLAGALVHRTS